jgi:sterol desaturase/sphingolipid hydroxylase (fatty acid hydroxylase superfamily)
VTDHRLIALAAIPSLAGLIAAEASWLAARGRGRPPLDDVLSGLGCAIAEQGSGFFLYVGMLWSYEQVWARWALLPLDPGSWWVYPLAIGAVDLAFYAFHRFAHTTALGWAVHAVHHQSCDVHFAAATRNAMLGGFVQFAFLLPLAVVGIPPLAFVAAKAFNPLYQLWVHTRAIGPIVGFDEVFNSPANHRVHHGTDPRYRDKNFGGVLVVWDRLFGTYQREEGASAYGILGEAPVNDPLAANLRPLLALARAVRSGGPGALFLPPGAATAGPPPRSGAHAGVAILQVGVALPLLGLLLSGPRDLLAVCLAGVVITAGSAAAAWRAGRSWAPWLDAARLAAVTVYFVGRASA